MESPFDELLQDLTRETSDSSLNKTVGDIVQINSLDIIKMVKNRLRYGQGVNGGSIGKYRDPDYAAFKHKKNPLAGYGNVDLFLTGELSDNITVIRRNDKFEIISTDEKYKGLANKYGAEQFGLTEEQLQEFLYECYLLALETIINKTYGK